VLFPVPKSNDSVRSRHLSAVIRYRNPSSKCQTQRDLAQVLRQTVCSLHLTAGHRRVLRFVEGDGNMTGTNCKFVV